MLILKALWKKGYRYRKNRSDLSGTPDIVFQGARLAIFVDGDFWHGKDWGLRITKLMVGHNPEYWVWKIEKNMDRDLAQVRKLEADDGWSYAFGSQMSSAI